MQPNRVWHWDPQSSHLALRVMLGYARACAAQRSICAEALLINYLQVEQAAILAVSLRQSSALLQRKSGVVPAKVSRPAVSKELLSAHLTFSDSCTHV